MSIKPYLIHTQDETPLFLGWVWETWRSDDDALISCAVLTRKPLPGIEHIHKRMPVVVPPAQLSDCFEATLDDARAIAEHAHPNLEWYAVSRYVNNARNDDPLCMEKQ